FPNSVCGVVYEGSTRVTGCQFTFTCDGSMERRPVPALWNRARKVADAMLAGAVYAAVGNATHYHADYVVPYWAASLVKTRVEGVHLFYRWSGGWGRPAAFGRSWSNREGDPKALRLAALSAPRAISPGKVDGAIAALAANGAEIIESDGRVRIRFSAAGRAASDKVSVTPYVDRLEASDNLRYALDGGASAAEQPAFGKASDSKAPAQ
ncbi:MAG: cell wall hydrolase, partial [Sphingomicrobium sp.]